MDLIRLDTLILRRANLSRSSGSWSETDFDVSDGDRNLGGVYCADSYADRETWFWGVNSQFTRKRS